MVRSMMSQTTLPKSFWDYALETVARILNMVPTKKVEKTPYKVWHGQALKLSYLKVWGCKALVKWDTLTKPDKLEPISIKCIFIGYPKETMGYSFYYLPENKLLVARNAEFLENSLITQEASGSLEDLEIIQEEDTHPSIDTSLNHEEDDLEIDEPQSDIVPICRSTRTRNAPNRMCLYIDAEEHELRDLGEPDNYKAALLDPESDKWLNAMNVEMQSMKDNEKTDIDGSVHTYKARLVAKGYTQTLGINYEETFSPVTDIRGIRILIAIAAFYDYEIWQMDVKTAFLNGYLSEELKVSCYTDAGYLTDADDLKSQTGYVFVLNRGAVDWKSTKQSIFATSSAEAEYIAAYDASKEAVWVRKFISGLGVVPTIEEPINMYCDNTRAIAIANESTLTKGARHFRAKVYYLREVIEYGDIKLKKVHKDDNLADPFTKALAFPKHSEHTRNIGMHPASSLM
ncbi:retrotransposon protein, putative, ty1-copia subclass [Tanacetum coccineum]